MTAGRLTYPRLALLILLAALVGLALPALPLVMTGLDEVSAFSAVMAQEDQDPPKSDDTDRKLQQIRDRMQRERKAISTISGREGNVIEKLETIQQQLQAEQENLQRLEQDAMIMEADAADLADQMKSYEQLTAGFRRGMKQRLRVRYRFGRSGYSRVIFTARDIPDLARRMFYLGQINRSDLAKLRQGRELIGLWSEAQQRLDSKRAHLQEMRKLSEEQKRNIEADKVLLEKVLDGIRRERRQHEAALAELNRGKARLMGVIAGLDKKRTEALTQAPALAGPAGAFAALRGSLCQPAAGPVLVGYGKRVHPQFNTETMFNGIEIGAPKGAKVHAVSDGVVRFAEWFRGYGNLVILDHGDGYYTVYAHLAAMSVRVGQEVKTGQVLGTVGDTGSIDGPSLYFEVRHHQKPENPAAWLGGCTH